MCVMTAGERDPAGRGYEFGPRLKAAREAEGLSQRAAAAKAQISNMIWSGLEKGSYRRNGQDIPMRPTADTVLKAAAAVGLDPREALHLAGLAEAPAESYQPRTAVIEREIARKLSRLTQLQLQAVNTVIDTWLYPDGTRRPDLILTHQDGTSAHIEFTRGHAESAGLGVVSDTSEPAAGVGVHEHEDDGSKVEP